MNPHYIHDTMIINNRIISIDDILSSREVGNSDFEANTFAFIGKWFSSAETFHLRTSGSTGQPKDIVIERSSMTGSAHLTLEALNLRPGQTSLVCLDTRYIAGQMMLVRSFVGGLKIVAVEPSANPFTNVQREQEIDFVAVVPYHVYHIINSNDSWRMNSVTSMIIGGAPLPEHLSTQLTRFSCACYSTYGMTETVSHIALQRLNGSSPSEFFEVLPGIKVELDDRNCLLIDAPYLRETVITNDIVELGSFGHFRWIGRWDNIINSAGVKISPEEIEKIVEVEFARKNLHEHFAISSVLDSKLGEKMVLVIEGEMKDKTFETSLFEHLREVLPAYRSPKEIVYLPFIPQTNTGKTDRKRLKKMLSERP